MAGEGVGWQQEIDLLHAVAISSEFPLIDFVSKRMLTNVRKRLQRMYGLAAEQVTVSQVKILSQVAAGSEADLERDIPEGCDRLVCSCRVHWPNCEQTYVKRLRQKTGVSLLKAWEE